MDIFYYILFLVLFLVLNIFYHKIKNKDGDDMMKYHSDMVKAHLINENDLGDKDKPFLWLHMHNSNSTIPTMNSRNWLNFGSRNTNDINMPYQYLTVESIIEKCGEDFNICIINDESFKKIIPGWTIELNNVANPIKYHLRYLALMNVMHIYGGLLLPTSFICKTSLISLYEKFTNNTMCVGEFINRTNSSDKNTFLPYPRLIGCKPGCVKIQSLISYLQVLQSRDFVAEQDFLGLVNNWLNINVLSKDINIIDGMFIGTKDTNGKPVLIEELISSNYIDMHDNICGVYIPWDELINRKKYQWFSKLTPHEVLESDTNISRFLLAYK